MRWAAVWVVLVLAAVAYLTLIGRSLWRRSKAVVAEYQQARGRLDEAAGAGRNVTFLPGEPTLPILDDPAGRDRVPWHGPERRRADRRSGDQSRVRARHRAHQG